MATKGRSTKKKDGARSVRHGNVTYSSRPSDNTDCRIRCSPPSRQTFGDGSKQTTVRYRHRTLDIKSPPSGKKRKPGVRTGPKAVPKTAPAKTAKTAKKTVPKAPKAPETPSKLSALVKELEKEVQKPKAPVKKTPAKKAPAKVKAPAKPTVKKTATEVSTIKKYDKLPSRLIPTFSKSPLIMAINHSDFLNKDYIRLKRDFNGNGTPIAEIVNMIQKRPDLNVYYEDIQLPLPRKDILKILKARPEYKSRSSAKTTAPAKKTSTYGLSPEVKEFLKATGQKSPKQAQVRKIERPPVDMDKLSPDVKEFLKATGQKTTVKKAPAVKKTVSPGAMPNTEIRSWYMAKFPTDELGKQIRPKLTFAKVWAEMKKGSDYYSMMPGDSVMRERVFDGISDAYKIPYDTVSATWLNADKTAVQMKKAMLNKAAKEGMNVKELDKHLIVGGIPKMEPKTTAKKPVAKAPAKAPAKPTAPIQPRGVAGKFDAKQMKEIMSFVDKLKGRSRKAEPMRVPIFRQSASFIDEGRIMLVKVTSRIPGKSLVGLPLSKTKADIWVPADKIKARIGQMAKDVQTVEYVDESFKGAYEGAGQLRFTMGNLVASTQAYDYYGQEPKIPPLFKKRTQEDVIFRTTQSRFATDMKKAMDSCPKDGQCVVQVCPEGKYSRNEGMVPNECSTYDADYMKMIANVISKAKNSSCVVMYRPNWPIKVVCDFGMYLVEIFLAPVVYHDYE